MCNSLSIGATSVVGLTARRLMDRGSLDRIFRTMNLSDLAVERPEFLYKYCSAARAVQILRDRNIYLAPVDRLNDLFEFAFLALLAENTETPLEYYRKNLVAYGLKPESAREVAEDASKTDVSWSYNKWKNDVVPQALRKIREHSGVTSFSAEADNQRMWATYGDDHRGVCMEFAIGRDECPFEGLLLPVIYFSGKTGLTFSDLMNEDGSLSQEVLIFLSTIKHEHWRDEKEWRILFLDNKERGGDSRKFWLRQDTISRVYLGPRIGESEESEINEIIAQERLDISVFKRNVDGLFGTVGHEGFEFSSSAEGVFYWLKKLNPGASSMIDTLLDERRRRAGT